MTRLLELREQIDSINQELLRLIQARGELVLEIGDYKRSHDRQAFDPDREEQMLQALESQSAGPYSSAAIREIFDAIFRASRQLQVLERDRAVKKEKSGT
jgi:3-deoxy-7-phosphoheptulonate synthase/chorismate mutase